MEAPSLLKVERDTSRERTRFKRANFLDFRRSFSTAEHSEVKEIPVKEMKKYFKRQTFKSFDCNFVPESIVLSLALFISIVATVEANEQLGDNGGVIVDTLDVGETLESDVIF